jgi:hypothetical protein
MRHNLFSLKLNCIRYEVCRANKIYQLYLQLLTQLYRFKKYCHGKTYKSDYTYLPFDECISRYFFKKLK